MGNDTIKSVEEMLRDVYEKTKPEVESFIKSVESMFDVRVKNATAEKADTDEDSPETNEFDASAFTWIPNEVYVIDASDRLVVTGTVPVDDKLSFTKFYNFTTGEFRIQGMRELNLIVSVRTATSEERELLLPQPSIAEALQILRKTIETPIERKAFDVVRSALIDKAEREKENGQESDAARQTETQNEQSV